MVVLEEIFSYKNLIQILKVDPLSLFPTLESFTPLRATKKIKKLNERQKLIFYLLNTNNIKKSFPFKYFYDYDSSFMNEVVFVFGIFFRQSI